jgi:hypothetical protein
VSVAGWATSTTNQTPSVSPAPLNPLGVVTHDAYLERFLAGLKNLTYADKNQIVKVWNLTWKNSTIAHLDYTVFNKTLDMSLSYSATYIKFPTTLAATNYFTNLTKGLPAVIVSIIAYAQYGSIVKIPNMLGSGSTADR